MMSTSTTDTPVRGSLCATAIAGTRRYVRAMTGIDQYVAGVASATTTALHIACSLNDDSRIVDHLLVDLEHTDTRGNTPLHVAVAQGNVQVVEMLLRHGANPDAVMWATGYTPLHLSAMGAYTTVTRSLLAHGARVSSLGGPRLCTPLHIAASHGSWPCIRALIGAGADPRALDIHGISPMEHISKHGGADNKVAIRRLVRKCMQRARKKSSAIIHPGCVVTDRRSEPRG